MKQKLISKLILGTMISTTLCTLIPVTASAEWVTDYQNNWYYNDGNSKLTGWKEIDGQIYYFDENGKMQKGWIKADNLWYYLQSSGALKTGWIKHNNKFYYADSTGAIQTGIINIVGKIYILDENGVMKTSNTVINGQFYTIGSDGQVLGNNVPTPDKEFDSSGKCIAILKTSDEKYIVSPIGSTFNTTIEDKSEANAEKEKYYGVEYTVIYRDSDGTILKKKTVAKGKSVDLYEPTKDGYNFVGWDTKSDGSGKNYDEGDDVELNKNLTLYAQWTKDTTVYVESIIVTGNSSVAINTTSQMTVKVLPDGAKTNVEWSVTNGTGSATINSDGLLTAVKSGTVTVKATAKDGSKVSGTKQVTVSETAVQPSVTSISIDSKNGSSKITTSGGTLEMVATISPDNTNNQVVKWSVEDRTGSATISDTGIIKAVSNGTITVKATITTAGNVPVVGTKTITISGQTTAIPVKAITVTSKNDATTIEKDGGTLQMTATIEPSSATNKEFTWEVKNGTGKASISPTGLLKAEAGGTVTVKAISKENSAIVGTKEITISAQSIKVTKLTIIGGDISTDKGTSIMSVTAEPTNTTNAAVTWTVIDGTGHATIATNTINGTATLTAVSNGKVTVKATAKDGSGIIATKEILLSNQNTIIPIKEIAISGISIMRTDDQTLDLTASFLPTYATSPASVTWSVINGTTGSATCVDTSAVGHYTAKLTAVADGTVTVKITVENKDLSVVNKTEIVKIYNQVVQVESIAISSVDTKVAVDGYLQMSAKVSPDNATKQNVDWTVESVTGTATISSTGVLKGGSTNTAGDGYVYVVATSQDYKKVVKREKITITPKVNVTSVSVSGELDATTITADKGTLKMTATAQPSGATNKEVTWSFEPYTEGTSGVPGSVTIVDNLDGTATLKAVKDGKVIVKATSKDKPGVFGQQIIEISGQKVYVTGITVKSAGDATEIPTSNGTLQMSAAVEPSNANNSAVTWSVQNGTGSATISSSGLLTAGNNGTVTVKATAADGSGTVGTKVITINAITAIAITGGDTVVAGGTLKFSATITSALPNKTVTWSAVDYNTTESNYAAIDNTGKLTALAKGFVKVTATATDGSGKSQFVHVTIK